MKHVPIILITLCGALALIGCAALSESAADTTLEDRFATFVEWFPGRYDSAKQSHFYDANAVPEPERNYRRHSIFRQVDLPAFGETVVLAHQYRDGNPETVYRQRLYTFRLDQQRGVFWLRVHVPKDSDALKGAYQNPDRLAGLTPDDFTVWDGCDLYWQWENERFVGRLEEGACRFRSDAFGQEIVLEETLTLSEDRITFADRGLSLSSDYLFGMRGDTPNISLKVRPFLCQWGEQTVWLHDQGGQAKLGTRHLKLEHWVPDAEEQDAGLTLSLIEGGIVQTRSFRQVDSDTINMVIDGRNMFCRHTSETLYSEGGI